MNGKSRLMYAFCCYCTMYVFVWVYVVFFDLLGRALSWFGGELQLNCTSKQLKCEKCRRKAHSRHCTLYNRNYIYWNKKRLLMVLLLLTMTTMSANQPTNKQTASRDTMNDTIIEKWATRRQECNQPDRCSIEKKNFRRFIGADRWEVCANVCAARVKSYLK